MFLPSAEDYAGYSTATAISPFILHNLPTSSPLVGYREVSRESSVDHFDQVTASNCVESISA